jgi:hypothetical protein
MLNFRGNVTWLRKKQNIGFKHIENTEEKGVYFDKPENFAIHAESAQKLTPRAKITKIDLFLKC